MAQKERMAAPKMQMATKKDEVAWWTLQRLMLQCPELQLLGGQTQTLGMKGVGVMIWMEHLSLSSEESLSTHHCQHPHLHHHYSHAVELTCV